MRILHIQQVGGLISLNFGDASDNSSIALSFTESPLFINPLASDDSLGAYPNMSYDGVLSVPTPLPTGYWTQPTDKLRGGFRFLTLSSTSQGSITLSNVSCYLNFMPHFDSLRNYSGYFYASDPDYVDENFLTRVSTFSSPTDPMILILRVHDSCGTLAHIPYNSTPSRQIPAAMCTSPLQVYSGSTFLRIRLKHEWQGWANNASLDISGPVLVDGAKRDR